MDYSTDQIDMSMFPCIKEFSCVTAALTFELPLIILRVATFYSTIYFRRLGIKWESMFVYLYYTAHTRLVCGKSILFTAFDWKTNHNRKAWKCTSVTNKQFWSHSGLQRQTDLLLQAQLFAINVKACRRQWNFLDCWNRALHLDATQQ